MYGRANSNGMESNVVESIKMVLEETTRENIKYIREKVAKLKATNLSKIKYEYQEECKTHRVSFKILKGEQHFYFNIYFSNKTWEGIEFFEIVSRWVEEIKDELHSPVI